MMDLLLKFKQHWNKQFPQHHTANTKLLVAVSGGVDSIVLTDLLVKSGFEVVLAHCNFQLRGEESSRDEKFVRELAWKHHIDIAIETFDTGKYAAENKVSIQEAARELRYEWFRKLQADYTSKGSGIQCLVTTAHHADDNIETVLMKFFRGTGIRGIRGILPYQKEQHLIRPLLPFRKKELEAYAKENGLNFVEDSSNASDKYIRNFFRHQLIPAIEEAFPDAEENITRNIERFAEVEELYQQAIQSHKQKLLEQKGNEFHIPVLKLKKASPLNTIVWEIVREFGFTALQTGEAIKLIDADNGAYIKSHTHRIIKNRNWLIIAPEVSGLQHETAQHVLIEAGEKKVVFGNGVLKIEQIVADGFKIPDSNLIVAFDTAHIKFPLLLRKAKQGDYFYPLGMKKKKKLSRFFIDQKLSKTEKENVWVIESNKKIVWVIGYRIDDRVRITPSTKSILQLSYAK